jgi:hypothetical protein
MTRNGIFVVGKNVRHGMTRDVTIVTDGSRDRIARTDAALKDKERNATDGSIRGEDTAPNGTMLPNGRISRIEMRMKGGR